MERDLPWYRCSTYKPVGRSLLPLQGEIVQFFGGNMKTEGGATVSLTRSLLFDDSFWCVRAFTLGMQQFSIFY